jgi:hypothetical protein
MSSKQSAKKMQQTELAGCLLGLLVDPKDRESTFLQNITKLLLYYMTPHPRRWSSSSVGYD